MSIALLNSQDCTRCPALVASRRRIVHGYGDPRGRIAFVGEAPGRHGADRTGVPFSGDKSGRVLQRMLIALELMEESGPADLPTLHCFVTNVVRCCPPSNRTPTRTEQVACAPYLWQELDALDARIIVPVGLVALQTIGQRYLGEIPAAIRPLHAVPIHAGGRGIVPLIHPARIAHTQIDAFLATVHDLLADL